VGSVRVVGGVGRGTSVGRGLVRNVDTGSEWAVEREERIELDCRAGLGLYWLVGSVWFGLDRRGSV
jgi:hypothetical protein